MKIIYYASDLIQAQMLSSMLNDQGIPATVNGLNLFGGVGELPAHDLLNIAVANSQAKQAKTLIKDYLSADIIQPD